MKTINNSLDNLFGNTIKMKFYNDIYKNLEFSTRIKIQIRSQRVVNETLIFEIGNVIYNSVEQRWKN